MYHRLELRTSCQFLACRICALSKLEKDIVCFNCSRLSRDILSLAAYMHDGLGISCVIIGKLLRRQPWALSRDFNRNVVTINQLLKDGCPSLDGVHF